MTGTTAPTYQMPERNLGLDLVRVTEAAAMAAGRWVGKGDEERGDEAAVDQMRLLLRSVPFRGVVVIGEAEKDEAPMLHNGEIVGSGVGPGYDVAVDPVDGTTLLAKGMPNALAMIAIAERGAMFNPKDVICMDKLVVGAEAADVIDIDAPVETDVYAVAAALRTSKDVVDAMERDSGVHLDVLKVDGGVTANDLCMQIQADVLGVGVSRPVVAETTALGAAYAAGLAVGFWEDLEELRRNWEEDRRWTPRWDDAQRSTGHARWRKAVDRTLGWVDVG